VLAQDPKQFDANLAVLFKNGMKSRRSKLASRSRSSRHRKGGAFVTINQRDLAENLASVEDCQHHFVTAVRV
jgi:hypothetical protein